ncbi:hypothetical protein E1B28_007919 [Marasmius oreades]|uniref:Uncharacterized protein n=1 Tax=Marasmius oreades TaxID=181124 RepID=A0A9P7S2W0_9AGAR|nr:uncharacterized protein E1B28_007919 [Marasmius oreades]KAG7094317.1 hypothetical protein E1B28_007919 [Marasmius oreades]
MTSNATANANANSHNTRYEKNIPLKRRSAFYAGTANATSSTTPLLRSSGLHMPIISIPSKSAQKHEEPTRINRGGHGTATKPFTDYTNVPVPVVAAANCNPGQQTGTLSDAGGVKDEEQVGMWMEELRIKEEEERGNQLGSSAGEDWNHMLGEGVGNGQPNETSGGTLGCTPDIHVGDETPQTPTPTPTPTCDRADRRDSEDDPLKLRSRFSEDSDSTYSDLSDLPKPIGYPDMSLPVFTNPFGGNAPLAPLAPLTQTDFIPLPNVFLQPGGYKEPPSRKRKRPPPTEESTVLIRANDISPFDTSEMTRTDRKLLKRMLFEEFKRVSRKPPLNPTKPGLVQVFRARQREIKARKPGRRPPRPKRSLVFPLPYFLRRQSRVDGAEGSGGERGSKNADKRTHDQEGGFSGFVRWAIPRGMAKWVLRQ